MSHRVLVVDDERDMCEMLTSGLRHRGYAAEWRTSAAQALQRLTENPTEVLVADLNMPETDGVELCRRVAASHPDVPVIVITAFGSLETAVAAIRAGAYDFITKPFEIEALALAVERAIQHRELRREVTRLRKAVSEARRFGDILGDSDPLKRVYSLIESVASSDSTVLITGESGTGKELVAHALHDRSARREGPFAAINCAAMSESLLESELFGHVRGAFTDAKESRAGLFVRGRGGTVFLDELGEMPKNMQAKLLRVLETRTVLPVGSDTEIPIDIRIVAATNRDLESEIEEGRFRADLYFRVNVIRIEMPPLRARGNDVLLLAQEFIDRAAARAGKPVVGLSAKAAERLLAYSWPGNVRELQNAVEHAVALTGYENIMPDDLPERIRDHRSSHVLVAADDPSQFLTMAEVERRYVLRVLEASGGNKTLAAKILGFDRRTMYRKLQRYAGGQLDVPDDS